MRREEYDAITRELHRAVGYDKLWMRYDVLDVQEQPPKLPSHIVDDWREARTIHDQLQAALDAKQTSTKEKTT